MRKLLRKSAKTAHLLPGTLVYTGKERTEKVQMQVIDYSEDKFEEKKINRVEDIFAYRDKDTVSWINIDGIHDIDIISRVGAHFNIHPLTQEDIVTVIQRPKLEEFDEYTYLAVKQINYDPCAQEIKTEHISFILAKNLVITFQETPGDAFDIIRDRLRYSKGKIRKLGADYLVYSLLDAMVDSYFTALESVGEKIGLLEEELAQNPTPHILRGLHNLKREFFFLRKHVWPVREIVNKFQHIENKLVSETTMIYLRDVYDHTIQIIDTVETYRDILSGLLDLYLSSISNKMNEIMKVLTIIATFFMPLTFLTGLYGMNFKYMPELGWKIGYPLALLLMLTVSGVMYLFFRRKKWM